MRCFRTVFLSLCHISTVLGQMKPKVVGGFSATVHDFPYSAFLSISCHEDDTVKHYRCGASIINQDLILTAAHCLGGCTMTSVVVVYVGSERKFTGQKYYAKSWKLHENYSTNTLENDICLIMLKNQIEYAKDITRVAIMENPPSNERAYLAGWGATDHEESKSSLHLKAAEQKVWDKEECEDIIGETPEGTFCAGNVKEGGYAARGDSGSPLVVRGYIEIGLVSYKIRTSSRSLVVYTSIGYFYKWIINAAHTLFCQIDNYNI